MPLAAPDMPRKMLPPPITMQICVPARVAGSTSAAMRSTVSTSMPYDCPPINASPEIFSSTRRYFGVEAIYFSLVAGHLFDFVREVAVGLFDALADLEADKASNFNRRPEVLGSLLDDLFDACLAIDDKCLMEQDCLFVEFSHAPLHHLFDDIVGLAGLFGYFSLNRAFAIEHGLVQMLRRQCQGRGCSDMHGELFTKGCKLRFVGRRFERDQDTDLSQFRRRRVVDIGRDHTRIHRQGGRSADTEIFADLGNQFGQCRLSARRAHFAIEYFLEVATFLQCQKRRGLDEPFELIV